MKYVDRSFCESCVTRSLITSSLVEHDGYYGVCSGCGTRVVRHDCTQASFGFQPTWLPVLEDGISAVCPTCGLVITIGRGVAATPEIPDWIRSLAAVAVVGAVICGTGILLDALLEA